MPDMLPVDKLAALAGRTVPQIGGYLDARSFADEHAVALANKSVPLLTAIEIVVASQLARMCPDRQLMVRLTKRVMGRFDGKRDTYPGCFAYDPRTDRSEFGASAMKDAANLVFRLTAAAYPHPGQGWAQDHVGVLSLGFVFLNLAEIIRLVFEAIDAEKEPQLPPPVAC